MMRHILLDATRNTFHFYGRTSRKGFWPYLLIHFAVFFAMFQIEWMTSIRFSEKVWLAYITLAGIPFIALFFRRLHDISASRSFDAEVCFAALVVLLDFLFLGGILLLLRLVFFVYFLPKLLRPSADGANAYGPKPETDPTTFPSSPEDRTPLRIRLQKIAGFVFLVLGLFAWVAQNKEIVDCVAGRHLSEKFKEALALEHEIKIQSLFGTEYKNANVLLLFPYMSLRNIECPGYSADFFEKIEVETPMTEGVYKLVVFDSSGVLASVKFSPSLCIKSRAMPKKNRCPKFENAVFVPDNEEGRNDIPYTCHTLIQR
jgi:uncharacterized membrane protein YhaH (DUF805 family)